jgi:hypothetical protein
MRASAPAGTSAILALSIAASACGIDLTGAPSCSATVRFVNLTTTTLDVSANGSTGAGFASLSFARPTTCLFVDPGTSFTFTESVGVGGSLVGAFTPALGAGGDYTIVAYTGDDWLTHFVALENSYDAAPGQSGLRVSVLTPTPRPLDMVVSDSRGSVVAVQRSIRFEQTTPFFSVPSGLNLVSVSDRNEITGTSRLVLTLPFRSLLPSETYTLIVAPSLTNLDGYRPLLVSGC